MFKFISLDESKLELVLNWRLSEAVAPYMFTDVENNLEKQRAWFADIKHRSDCHYWLIYHADVPIGLINITEINLTDKTCTWGFYIGDENFRNLGGLIPPYFYNYVFNHTQVETISAEVLDINQQVIKLHLLHGYRQAPEKSSQIIKHNREHQVFYFELNKADWLTKKRFSRYIADFI